MNFSDFAQECKGFSHKIYFCPSNDKQPLVKCLGENMQTIGIVGGEKGLSPLEEEILLNQGFLKISLGPYVQRAVTAAVCGGFYLIKNMC